jgi:hypothetical protein
MPARKTKYPFSSMQPGDSFEFPADEKEKVQSAASSYGRRHDMTFKVRTIDEDRARCWRTK